MSHKPSDRYYTASTLLLTWLPRVQQGVLQSGLALPVSTGLLKPELKSSESIVFTCGLLLADAKLAELQVTVKQVCFVNEAMVL